jgi:hypothetical protein
MTIGSANLILSIEVVTNGWPKPLMTCMRSHGASQEQNHHLMRIEPVVGRGTGRNYDGMMDDCRTHIHEKHQTSGRIPEVSRLCNSAWQTSDCRGLVTKPLDVNVHSLQSYAERDDYFPCNSFQSSRLSLGLLEFSSSDPVPQCPVSDFCIFPIVGHLTLPLAKWMETRSCRWEDVLWISIHDA